MARRVIAWFLLIGFVILLVNILFIQYMLPFSVIAYIFIVLVFLFANKKRK
ncbi:MAG: hypothetical protein N2484_07365 [Clostridia bacterium]|nr:hypothetical protein [Clostridia bacterium]